MSLSSSDIGLFYKQIDDLKSKLIHILKQYGKETEIVELHKYFDKLMALKKINVRKPIELFYEYCVIPVADDILMRNDSFFLGKFSTIEKTYDNVSENEDNITKKDIFFVSQIRDIWSLLQPNIKNNIWNYVQVICRLAEKILNGTVLVQRSQILKNEGKLDRM